MPAFTENEYYSIELAVRAMRDHHSMFERHELSIDDFYELFCADDDARCLKRALALAGPNAYSYNFVRMDFTVNDRIVNVVVVAGAQLVLPKDVKDVRDGAPSHLVDRLVHHAAVQSDIAARYSRVIHLVQHLRDLCAAPAQSRFLWPAIDTIVSRIENGEIRQRLLTKLARNSRAAVPPVSPALREACRDAAETVATFQLLPEKPPEGKDAVRVTAQLASRFAVGPLGNYHTI